MANLSQIRRQEMLDCLAVIKEEHDDDETIKTITEIENYIREEKYGLVWEEHSEHVDEMLAENIPILTEYSDKKISALENGKYDFIIEGDNLQSLYLLEKTHQGQIDIIYIDPPYNTGKKDFDYNDSMISYGDNYIHSNWISFMEKRLKAARKLLNETGVIFISIDDNELANLRLLCDEIFLESNFVSLISVENNPKGRKNSKFISVSNDYLLIYAKDSSKSSFVENIPKDRKELSFDDEGNFVHNSGKRVLVGENSFNDNVTDFNNAKHYTVYYRPSDKNLKIKKENEIDQKDEQLISEGYERFYSYNKNGFVFNTYSADKLLELQRNSALDFKNGKIYEKNFSTSIRMKSIITNQKYRAVVNNKEVDYQIDVKTTSAKQELKNIFNTREEVFSNPKNTGLVKLILTLFDKKDCIVLDFFAGSGTTGQAVLEQNSIDNGTRQFILCTNNEITEGKQINYFVQKGYIKEPPKTNMRVQSEWSANRDLFSHSDEYQKEIESEDYHSLGICQSVTYPRIKTVITGKRTDGTKYSDGIPSNLKYLKCDWITRNPDNYFPSNDALYRHIKAMIELQNGIDLDNVRNVLILYEDDFYKYVMNDLLYRQIEHIWVNQNIDFNSDEMERLNSLDFEFISMDFFEQEL